MKKSLCYVSLERLRPATAVDTHVRGVLGGLQSLGWTTRLVAEIEDKRSSPGILRQAWRYLYIQLAAGFQLRNCDIVYVRQHFATSIVVTLAWLLRVPVVLELNGLPNDIIASNPRLARAATLIHFGYVVQFRLASKILVVTDGIRDFVGKYSDDAKIVVVPNGADAELFRPDSQPRPPELPDGKYVILFGDFAVWHDNELLVTATNEPNWPADVQVVIVGRSRGNSPMQHARSALVHQFDWVPQERLVACIVNAMAGIVPISESGQRSVIGAIPLKLLEVLSCGRPAIVSNIPTQSELIAQNDCGLIFSPGDSVGLAAAVRTLSELTASDVDAKGARGRALVEATYNWRSISSTINGILDQLIADKRR